jgi:hypothetical protein
MNDDDLEKLGNADLRIAVNTPTHSRQEQKLSPSKSL